MYARKTTAVLLTASENVNIGMHPDVYELILFKLANMKNATVLHILMIYLSDLSSNQGHRDARKPKASALMYLIKFSLDLNETWHALWACWSDEPHFTLYHPVSIQSRDCSWFLNIPATC